MFAIRFKREIPFIPKQRYFIALSLVAVLGSLIVIGRIGIVKGIDFAGGIKLTVRVDPSAGTTVTDGAVTAALAAAGIDGAVQHLGAPAERRFLIKLRQPEGEAGPLIDASHAALQTAFGATVVALEGQETVGPRVGKELAQKGQAAILFTLAAILIYVWFRFDFYFAPGALISLVHDVLITMGFLVWTHREYDLTTLAALLTIVGYSINDTIIIYDRIREHRREITPETIGAVANKAINDTLARTIVTSLTVLFVVVILFVTTEGVIKNFAFAFIIGTIAGSYSTIFVASPIYIWLYKRFPQWRKP